MAKSKTAQPSMSDAAVKAKTGRDWAGWFAVLDRAGAASLEHKAIVALLSDTHGVPAWWRQMVAVEYERARGLRALHQTASGYSVAVSRTLATSLPKLYAAAASDATRAKWFPKGKFEGSSQTRDKYFRGAWGKGARLEINFYSKGPDKAQLAVQISKLAGKADVETQRGIWKSALGKLQELLEP
jgi:hypothetical protein